MDALSEIASNARDCYNRAIELTKERRRLDNSIASIERMIETAENRLEYLRTKTNKSIELIHIDLGASKVVREGRSLRMHVPLLLANILILTSFAVKMILRYISRGKGFF